jgi:DNA-binding NarL/FixJ family response regulator
MRVAIADDSALFRDGLTQLLTAADMRVVAEAKSGDELLVRISADPPDAAILDIRMPPTFTDEGIRTAGEIRSRFPGVAILVLSTYAETSYALTLLRDGAAGMGYLLKDRVDSVQALIDALTRLVAGESVIDPDIVTRLLARPGRSRLDTLTSRESEVLAMMAEGRSTIGISEQLHVSPKTVESQVSSIFTKLDLPSAADTNRRVLAVLTWLRESTHLEPDGH